MADTAQAAGKKSEGALTSFLKLSLGPLTSHITGGQISDFDIKAIAQGIQKSGISGALQATIERATGRAASAVSGGLINAADVKNLRQSGSLRHMLEQKNFVSLGALGLTAISPALAPVSALAIRALPSITPVDIAQAYDDARQAEGDTLKDKFKSFKQKRENRKASANQPSTTPQTQPNKNPKTTNTQSTPANQTSLPTTNTVDNPTEPINTTESPLPINQAAPPPQQEQSQPSKETDQVLQNAKKGSPLLSATAKPSSQALKEVKNPIDPTQTANRLAKEKAEDKQKESQSVGDQQEDDENASNNEQEAQDTEEEKIKEAEGRSFAAKELRKLKKKLANKRQNYKTKRAPAMFAMPAGKGMMEGGVRLLFYVVTAIVGVLLIFSGLVIWGTGKILYAFYHPSKTKKNKIKTPLYLRLIPFGHRRFQRGVKKILPAHNQSADSEQSTEKTLQQAVGPSCAKSCSIITIIFGILLTIAIIFAAIGAICEADLDNGVEALTAFAICKSLGL